MKSSLLLALIVSFDASGPSHAAESRDLNWSRFRGPNGGGAAESDRIPVRFGPNENVLWKNAVRPGHSSPIIWGDRIFLTVHGPVPERGLATLAIDRGDGGILWQRDVQPEARASFHPLNDPASSTPAADDRHVYVYFGNYGLLCYDHAGTEVWRRRLDLPKSKYGVATSPIVYGDTVILVLDGDDGSSRLLAVLARNDFEEPIFATPAVAENKINLRTAAHLYALGGGSEV
jgi:outer membrane protein assembly factor BamB